MNRVAFFGGTFDPVHTGHLQIARTLVSFFELDLFYFLPAFHAPHKPDRPTTSPYHRFAMLSVATREDRRILVSTHELDRSEPRYTIDTLTELKRAFSTTTRFFVIGGDSWLDIRTWRRWEELLLADNFIVVARPGFDLTADHVTSEIRARIRDIRGETIGRRREWECTEQSIYFTDSVNFDTSSTELREDLSDGRLDRTADVPAEVAKYIEKYELYK